MYGVGFRRCGQALRFDVWLKAQGLGFRRESFMTVKVMFGHALVSPPPQSEWCGDFHVTISGWWTPPILVSCACFLLVPDSFETTMTIVFMPYASRKSFATKVLASINGAEVVNVQPSCPSPYDQFSPP